jgi:hypothetical protein
MRPITGDPAVVAAEAHNLRAGGETMGRVAHSVTSLMDRAVFRSDAIDVVKSEGNSISGVITASAVRYGHTAEALAEYAPVLAECQRIVTRAIHEHDATDVFGAHAQVADNRLALLDPGLLLNPDEHARREADLHRSEQHLAEQKAAAAGAQAAYEGAMAELEQAAAVAIAKIEDAIKASHLNDSALDRIGAWVKDIADGLAMVVEEVVKAIRGFLREVGIALEEFVLDVVAISGGIAGLLMAYGRNILEPRRQAELLARQAGLLNYRFSPDRVPTFLIMAGCAAYAYNKDPKAKPENGYEVVDPSEPPLEIDPSMLDTPSGMQAVILRAKDGSIVVAFQGTDFGDVRDVREDFQMQALPSAQAADAIKLAIAVSSAYPDQKVTFTGHSLGGAQAELASYATGRPSYVFNAASIGAVDLGMAAGAGGNPPHGHIISVSTDQDFVSGTVGTDMSPNDSPADEQYYVHADDQFDPSRLGPGRVLDHDLDLITASLKKYGEQDV